MPPASPETTSVERSASSNDVLPWSTWPITVTTGGRGRSVSGASASPTRPTSTSASETRRTLWPNSVTTSSAVSASMFWVMVAITPMSKSFLTTLAPCSAMRLASSCTVMVSGITTSRACLTCASAWWSCCRRCLSRSRWRRNCDSLRVRSSPSSLRARVTVSLLRCFGSSRRGAIAGRLGPAPGRRARSSSSSSTILTLPAADSAATLAAAASPARLAISRREISAACSTLRCSARCSSTLRASTLGVSAGRGGGVAVRALASCCSRSTAARASAAACSSALRAPLSARARRAASSGVRPCGSTTPRRVGGGAAGLGASLATAGAASGRSGSPVPGAARLRRTSTCTVLERPCGKLCRTDPVSIGLRSSSLPLGRPPRVSGRFSSLLSAIALQNLNLRSVFCAVAEACEPGLFRPETFGQPALAQRRVDDTVARECLTKLGGGQPIGHRQSWRQPRELAATVGRTVGRFDQHGDAAVANGLVDLGEAGDRLAGTARQTETFNRAPHEQGLDAIVEIRIRHDVLLRRAREQPLGDRGFHAIAGRGQPQTAARQAAVDVGHDAAVRIDDKAQQGAAIATFARHQTATQRVAIGRAETRAGTRRRPLFTGGSCGHGALFRLGVWRRRIRGGRIGEPVGARLHDHGVGVVGIELDAGALRDLDQLVAGKIGQIVERLDAFFADRHQQRRAHAFDLGHLVGDAEFAATRLVLFVALFDEGERALLQLLGDLFLETFDAGELVDRHVSDVLDRREAFGHQQMGDDVVDIERLDEERRTGAEFLLAPLAFLGLGQDVDVPTGQLRGKPHVLAAPPDRQRQLIVGHHDLDAPLLLVHHHLRDLGRRQRVDDEGRRVLRPRDDVDLFALQLRHDRLDARAAHADASPDWIDAAIVRDHRDFGARARIARDSANLDDAVVDLGHFLGEQLGHELRMGARQENLRAAHFLAYVIDIGAYPLALAEAFARQQLVAAQDSLGAAQIDDDVAELDALDQAVDDFADAVLEFVELTLTFGVAHLLNDDLFRGLGRDAAEIDRRQRIRSEEHT